MKPLTFLWRYGGAITLVVYWSFTLVAMHHNPTFSVMGGALSDLGAPNANAPWIYNYGLILSFAPFFLYSLYLIYISENKIQTAGATMILISSVFLAFIGIFHSGTSPHGFVSSYFFLQFFFGMLVFSCGMKSALRYLGVGLFIAALIGAFLPWPSTAILEIYEIIVIAIFVIVQPILTPEKSGSKAPLP